MIKGGIASDIIPTFSTTTEIDKICFQISLMDITKNHFNFTVRTMCGIPTVYIDGTKEDWILIFNSINELLPKFDLGDWSKIISDHIYQIINSFDGKINTEFFNSIYKYKSMSGSDMVTGWINDFFPYVVENEKIIIKRNKVLTTSNFPSSINSVPFVWDYFGEKINMNFYSGFSGFNYSQYDAIRPSKNLFVTYKDIKENYKDENLKVKNLLKKQNI